MTEQNKRIPPAHRLGALTIGVLVIGVLATAVPQPGERHRVPSEGQYLRSTSEATLTQPAKVGGPLPAAVRAAAAKHVDQLVAERRLPPSASLAWRGTTTISETEFHRFALQLADTLRVMGSGLVVTANPDGIIRVEEVNMDMAPATLELIGGGSLAPSTILASIDTGRSPPNRPSWHGAVLDLSSRVPELLDRWQAADHVFSVDRSSGLIKRQGMLTGHGAYLATDEHLQRRTIQQPDAAELSPDLTLRGSGQREDEPTHTGSGLVYRTDPAAGEPEVLPLPGLLGDGSRLAGRYVSVSSRRFDSNGAPTPSSGPSGEFVYEPVTKPDANCVLYEEDCSLIDNVNAYHHIDRFARDFWTQRLGVDIDFATTVWTHTRQTGSLVHGDTIRLGSGGLFLNNNALEDDILYHEYVHVVLRHIGFAPDIFSTTQERALGEGYADYFALTFLNRPTFADWATRCPPRYECEGPEDSQEIRTLATDPAEWSWNYGVPSVRLKYGVCTRKHLEDLKCKTSWMTFDETYVWGMIWGSTLWDIREAIGSAAADELVIASLALTGGHATTFTTASGAILRADERLNAGANEATLRAIFAGRGITPFLSAGTKTEDETARQVDLHVEVYPNPVDSDAQVFVRASARSAYYGAAHVTVYDMDGRLVKRSSVQIIPGQTTPVLIDLSDTAAGAYFVVAQAGDEYATHPVMRVR